MLIKRVRSVPSAGLPEPARLLQDMERLLDSAWGKLPPERRTGVFPPLNITRDAQNVYVRAELPGVAPEDLEISVEGDRLSVAGSRRVETEEGVSYHRRERQAGRFDRTVTLPMEFDADGVRAHSEAGVLTITLPLAKSARPRRIAVESA